MALSNPSGFAIRRNATTCPSNEVNCGRTVFPFIACCPLGAFCPSQYNVNCCPSSFNCTETLLQKPSCANQTWTLYDNGGFFCCAPGTIGYAATTTNSNGCADPGFPPRGARLLGVVLAGQTAGSSTATSITSTSSSTTSTALSTTTQFPQSSSLPTTPIPQPKTSHTKEIAGGTVGGVLLISLILLSIWFFRRKTKAEGGETSPKNQNGMYEKAELATDHPRKIDVKAELSADGVNSAQKHSLIRHELPGSTPATHELA